MVKKNRTDALHEKNRFLSILEWIHSWLFLAVLYPLAGASVPDEGPDLRRFCGCSLVVLGAIILSYYMIRKIRSLALYLAGMLVWLVVGTAAVWYFAGSLAQGSIPLLARSLATGLTLFLSGIVFLVRLKSRIEQSQMAQDFEAQHEGEENVLLDAWESSSFLNHPVPQHWILFGFAYLPAVFESWRQSYGIIFGMLLADIFVCFLHFYMARFHQYIKDHHRMANMPLAMMKRVHKLLLGAGLAVFVIATLPAVLYFREPLDGWRPQIKIQVNLPAEEFTQEVQMETTESMNMMDLLSEDYKEPPAWLLWVTNVLVYGILAAGALGFIAYVWIRIKDVGRDYAHGDEDEVVFLDDVSEDLGELLYGSARAKDGFLSPNARIRRKYRKRIQKGTKGKPNRASSPAELERDAGWTGNEDEQNLHALYEKARYSRNGCSAQET